ncbi:MAG: carbohydrate ABC transporter permease [Nocardioidaceae bacterium]
MAAEVPVLARLRRRVPTWVAWVGGVLIVAFAALPLWYMVVLSLDRDPVGSGVGFIPERLSFDNYRVLSTPAFGFYPALRHSLLVSVGTTLFSLAVAVPASYALAKLPVRGRERVLAVMLALIFFPGIILLTSLGVLFERLDLLDQLFGIGVAQLSFTVPMAVWFVTYAFRQVPGDVEEAAKVDGADVARRIWHVILPMARPGVAGATVLVFVASWNDYIFGSQLNRSPRSETLPVMLAKLPSLGFLGGQMAAAVLVCLPVMLVVAALLRWLSARNDGRHT